MAILEIFGYKAPFLLIKVSSRREYLEDIANGKIFMNESGYFRKLEDNYRGDIFDGKCPINLESLGALYLELKALDTNGESLRLPIKTVKNFQFGFDKDDKVPMFCCSILTENILYKESESVFRFKDDFVQEMEKFGEFFMAFSGNEFMESIDVLSKESSILYRAGKVKYSDIFTTYDLDTIEEQTKDQYEPFFNKHFSYKWQNEWRLILAAKDRWLIDKDEHFFVANIKPLEIYRIGEVKELRDLAIVVGNSND